MLVKEILKDAIIFTGNDYLLGLNVFDESSNVAPTVEDNSLIDLYLRCFNFVYKEIALAYFPLYEKEEVEFADGKILLSDLKKDLIKVKKITENGRSKKFFPFPDYIAANVKKAEVIYSYLPADAGLDSDVELFSGRIIPQVMAYGVAREVELITGNFANSEMWHDKFTFGLQTACSQASYLTMPRRRFR